MKESGRQPFVRRARRLVCRTAALAALPCVLACASSGVGAGEPGGDLAALQARVLELQRKAAVAEVEIGRLRQQVAALEARAGGAARTLPVAPPAAAAPPVNLPAPAPTPRVEVQDLAEPPATAPAPPADAAQAGASAAAGETAPQVDAAGQAAYDEAYALFHQGRYVDAESSFQRFLQTYPRTDLTDNAFYWIGESRFARGDVRGALAAFRQTVESYPQGNKVPDALLKAGQCLQALGDSDGARASLQEIVKRFPESAAAVVARERLEAMN
jgi:tol-pal system protein YbgF